MTRGLRWFAVAGVLLIATAEARAVTWYVRQSGDDQNEGTSAQTAFRTVGRAAELVNHGDQIVVGPGTYRVAAMIADRSGTGHHVLRLDGDSSGEETGDAPGEVIFEPASATLPMLHLHRCRFITVSDITFRGRRSGQGLQIDKCRDVRVERCTFTGLSRGLSAENTQRLWVASTVVTRDVIGLFLKNTATAHLAHLSVAGCTSVGILILSSSDGDIVDSLFVSNNLNYSADSVSAAGWDSEHNVITGATGPWGDVPAIQNIYEWAAASGQERSSVHVVPAFERPEALDLHISPKVTWAGGLPGVEAGVAWGIVPIRDRDGKEFTWRDRRVCAGAYDYPKLNLEAPGAWKPLGVKIEPADRRKYPRQSAGIFRGDGTLVRTLLVDTTGVDELYWDGLDDLGQPAPAGDYEVRAVNHDVRVVDDGSIGDSGTALGAYNPDNNDRVVALPDGGFLTTAVYDEAGFTLRRFSSTGQSVFASALTEGDYWGLATLGDDVVGGLGKGADAKIVRLVLPGERAALPAGVEFYPVFAKDEKGEAAGLAVRGDQVCVALRGLNVIRVFDWKTGKKQADWPLENPGDVASDPAGTLWVLSGKDVVAVDATGKAARKVPTGLETPAFLAAAKGRLAVVDRTNATIALIDSASGKLNRKYGQPRRPGPLWLPVGLDTWRDPRGCAFLADGRLIVTEYSRLRTFWPETGRPGLDMLSNFMETAVVHPTRPEYVYCGLGIFEVDPKTGRWKWVVETPPLASYIDPVKKDSIHNALGSPSDAVVLGDRPFVAYADQQGRLRMLDVSDPLKPRLAMEGSPAQKVLGLRPYYIVSFSKNGDLVAPSGGATLAFQRIAFLGLDAEGNPKYDFEHPVQFGMEKDPAARGMKCVGALSCDPKSGDVYYLAVTDLYNKMVPGWGADGTGVGRSTPDGKPLWFARSSGGNYMSVSAINDGRHTWVLAGKSFGGQLDVFDSDGLRLTTGNWGWPSNYGIGFVDLRYGVHGYVRPDGKVGAYVEDDAIGRFARAKLDGGDTLIRVTKPFKWEAPATKAGPPPSPDSTGSGLLPSVHPLPKVNTLAVNGDWSAWEKAGVSPQVVALPTSVGFKRTMPDDLLESFRDGTYIAALAHDGESLYAYVVAADSTERFDAEKPADLWKFDGVEFWVEEEQFVFSLLRDGTPALHKFRHHDRKGEPWKANYSLAGGTIWGKKLDDLASHPLGRRLAGITGANFEGKKGYALMARIPFDEVKLVGGIAGRESKPVPMTGKAGELIRIAFSLNCVFARGRTQDCMIDWPSGRMFSDPTRSAPFRLE